MQLVYEALDTATSADTVHQEELAAKRVLDKAHVKVGWERGWGRHRGVRMHAFMSGSRSSSCGSSQRLLGVGTDCRPGTQCCRGIGRRD